MTAAERRAPATASGPLLARLGQPRSRTPTRIAVVSDIHFTTTESGTWKLLHETPNRLRAAIRDINARDVEYVQVLGDLTEDGRPEEFARVTSELEALDVPFGAIPGNHDVPKARSGTDDMPVSAFEDEFTSDGFPTVTPVGGITVIGLNTATVPDGSVRESWGGAVSPEQVAELDDILSTAETPLVCTHHNLGPLPEHSPTPPWTRFPVENAPDLRELLNEHGVDLSFSGHHHLVDSVPRGNFQEIYTPAVCSFPQSYLDVEITPAGTDIRLVPVADREALREAYFHATSGNSLGQCVLSMVERRLECIWD